MTSSNVEFDRWDDEGPPRFRLIGEGPPRRAMSRWIGLRRAIATTWHLRACLAFLMLFLGIASAIGKARIGGPFLVVLAIVPFIALLSLGTYLCVVFWLALVQAVTGWPLHDLESWSRSLRWWKQVALPPALIVLVCIPTMVMIIGSLFFTAWWLGMIK